MILKDEALKIRISTLNKELKSMPYFDVCLIVRVAELKGIKGFRNKLYDDIKFFHCVYYCDMSEEVKAALFSAVVIYLNPVIPEPKEPKNTFLSRLYNWMTKS